MKAPAKFITFEGIEGVGKSTAVQFVADYLTQKQIDHIVTREPGGTEIAEHIRDVLLTKHQETMAVDTELLLFYAARAQHVASLIKPALLKGQWVLCDRFTEASYAYQGGGRGIDEKHVDVINQWTLGNFQPDIIFILDAPVEIAFSRIKQREFDRIESEKVHFFERVREAYLQRAQRDPSRYKIIDASVTPDEVLAQIQKVLGLTCHPEQGEGSPE